MSNENEPSLDAPKGDPPKGEPSSTPDEPVAIFEPPILDKVTAALDKDKFEARRKKK